jgi:peptide-methionine (R)-S-oxide reductase
MKIHKPEEWKNILTPEQYHVLVEKGTERPFTGEYDRHFEDGAYVCGACGTKLFESQNKYDAGCGWPSFDQAIPGAVEFHEDNTLGVPRTEVTCATCGGHLGHVFPDGPKDTTGQRFCINSISLDFRK